MAQFDVFRNPAQQRDVAPYILGLQSPRFDRVKTRFVAALVLHAASRIEHEWLAPSFEIYGQREVLDLSIWRLCLSRASAHPSPRWPTRDSRRKITRALDEFLSQA